jgi:predicted transcriptional regulator
LLIVNSDEQLTILCSKRIREKEKEKEKSKKKRQFVVITFFVTKHLKKVTATAPTKKR